MTTTAKTIHLTRADFLKKVANFEETPDKWVYLGDKPAIIDFYADWCISCKVMERNVFSKPDVIQALRPYTLLQIDMTDNTRAQQALLDELGLFGPPAILFYRNNGEELVQARILGEMDREQFMDHLGKVARES